MHINFSDLPSFDGGGATEVDAGLIDDLLTVTREAVRSVPCAAQQATVLAAWEGQRAGARPLTRLVDALPCVGPLLVALATTVWIYNLLVIARTLLGG